MGCIKDVYKMTVVEVAKKYCRHPVCPVPTAVLKGIEASIELALSRDVIISIKNKD